MVCAFGFPENRSITVEVAPGNPGESVWVSVNDGTSHSLLDTAQWTCADGTMATLNVPDGPSFEAAPDRVYKGAACSLTASVLGGKINGHLDGALLRGETEFAKVTLDYAINVIADDVNP